MISALLPATIEHPSGDPVAGAVPVEIHPDGRVRLYRIEGINGPFWVAWMNPERALIPEDGTPSIDVDLVVGSRVVAVEPVITTLGQSEPDRSTARTTDGVLSTTLTHTPVFITPRGRD